MFVPALQTNVRSIRFLCEVRFDLDAIESGLIANESSKLHKQRATTRRTCSDLPRSHLAELKVLYTTNSSCGMAINVA